MLQSHALYCCGNSEKYVNHFVHEIMFALQQNNINCFTTDNLKLTSRYILFGAHDMTDKETSNSFAFDTIIVQTEQLSLDSAWLTNSYLQMLNKYEVWDYSRRNKEFLKKYYNIDSKLFSLGFNLKHDINIDIRDIDVLFYGSYSEVRSDFELKMKRELINRNIIFRFNDLWGKEKSNLLSRSKIVINLHLYSADLLEQTRIIEAINHGCLVISESCSDQIMHPHLKIVYTDDIVKTAEYYLNHDSERIRLVERARKKGNLMKTILPEIKNIFLCIYCANADKRDSLQSLMLLFYQYFTRLGYKVLISDSYIRGYRHIIFNAENTLDNLKYIFSNEIIIDTEDGNFEKENDNFKRMLTENLILCMTKTKTLYYNSLKTKASEIIFGYMPILNEYDHILNNKNIPRGISIVQNKIDHWKGKTNAIELSNYMQKELKTETIAVDMIWNIANVKIIDYCGLTIIMYKYFNLSFMNFILHMIAHKALFVIFAIKINDKIENEEIINKYKSLYQFEVITEYHQIFDIITRENKEHDDNIDISYELLRNNIFSVSI